MEEKKNLFQTGWIYFGILLLLFMAVILSHYSPIREISWQEFEEKILRRHAVEKVIVVNNEIAEVYIKQAFEKEPFFAEVMKPSLGQKSNPGPHFEFRIGSVDSFERKLDEAQKDFPEDQKVNVSYLKVQNWLNVLLPWVFPLLLAVLAYRFIRGTSGGGGASVFNFGRSTATLQEKGSPSPITFDDVAGLEEAKLEVREIVDFLKDPSLYTRLGAKIPKGVIIVGPPGTGKTLLAKAVAGEAKVPFFSLSGSEFVEMFVGVGASRVRDLFKRAKERAPSIIFIDEIDAVGRSRGKNTFYSGANDEREGTLNQLLTEMDGFGTNTGVIVLAATNRADMLDPALLRPGRFDRHIYLELPNFVERQAIFKVHLKPLVLSD